MKEKRLQLRQQPKLFVRTDSEEVIARKPFVLQAVILVMVTVKNLGNASASLDGQVCCLSFFFIYSPHVCCCKTSTQNTRDN